MRHFRIKPIIQSIKHFHPFTNAPILSGAIRAIDIVEAEIIGGARATTNIVWEGSYVKAVYLEVWLNGQGTSGTGTGQFVIVLVKLPASVAGPSVADMSNLMAYPNKKNILYTTMGNIGPQGNISIPVIRQWFAIPKGKQRFGLADRLRVVILSTGFEIDTCGISIYKEKS